MFTIGRWPKLYHIFLVFAHRIFQGRLDGNYIFLVLLYTDSDIYETDELGGE
jgi:hypothetical protein